MKTRNMTASDAIRFIKQRMLFSTLVLSFTNVIILSYGQGDRRLNPTMVLSNNSIFLKNVAMNLHVHIHNIDHGNVDMYKTSITTSTI